MIGSDAREMMRGYAHTNDLYLVIDQNMIDVTEGMPARKCLASLVRRETRNAAEPIHCESHGNAIGATYA